MTGLGLGWFGGGAWGQGGAPEDGGGRKRVRRTWGWGAQGLGPQPRGAPSRGPHDLEGHLLGSESELRFSQEQGTSEEPIGWEWEDWRPQAAQAHRLPGRRSAGCWQLRRVSRVGTEALVILTET